MAFVTQRGVQRVGVFAVLCRMGGVEVVVPDHEALVIAGVIGGRGGDQLLGGDAFLLGADHDGCAVGVFGTDEQAVMAAQFLEAHPDVSLHGLDDVAEMQWPVGVGQGVGNEDLARHSKSGIKGPLLSHGLPGRCRRSPADQLAVRATSVRLSRSTSSARRPLTKPLSTS